MFGFAPHVDGWRTVPEIAQKIPTRQITTYNGELKKFNKAFSPLTIALIVALSGALFLSIMIYLIWTLIQKYRPSYKQEGSHIVNKVTP